MLGLPTTATAPFCPSEVHGSIDLREGAPLWKRLLRVAGPEVEADTVAWRRLLRWGWRSRRARV